MRYSLASSRWVTTSVAFALVLFALCDPCRARAQESTIELTYQGAPGYWMPRLTFRRVTADVEALRLTRDLLVQTERALTLERQQGADLRSQLASFEATEATYESAISTLTQRNERLVERLERVKRRRTWLLALGFAAGALVVAVPVVIAR
jgi:septal ring factor EnvC (AmiA/AmiB activator)